MRIPRWLAPPENLTQEQRKNFVNVQIDAVGIGVHSAAVPFLPVFLTRLGATSFQVGLLTSIPALAGFLLGIPMGRFLQGRRNIVPWFSAARLLVISSYALTGLVPFFLPQERVVPAVLWIQVATTLPQTVVFVAFSVVMNAVAGPRLRYELMSRRWATLGATTAITAALAGQILDRLPFPLNYQLVFMGFSLGGLISYYYSSHIQLPNVEPIPQAAGQSWQERLTGFMDLVRGERAFVSFSTKRFIYQSGAALATPLFPLYYVLQVRASDAWIGFFNTAQSATVLLGYPFWTGQSRKRGARSVLLLTTLGLALYPALTAATRSTAWVAVYAALSGIFSAGLNLVFFDELMRTVPPQYSPTFVALAQSLQHLSTMVAPLLGTALADRIGLAGGLVVSAVLRLTGFVLFVRKEQSTEQVA